MASYTKFQIARNSFKNPNIFQKSKNNKKKCHELSKSERLVDGIEKWTGFYRCNIHRFIKDYFGKSLRLFQKILIFLMAYNINFIYLASRRQGKTYLLGWFSSAMCVLYPGIKIIIAGGTKQQGIMVINKMLEFKADSPNLDREIKYSSNSLTNPVIEFHNGSSVKAITPKDTARGKQLLLSPLEILG